MVLPLSKFKIKPELVQPSDFLLYNACLSLTIQQRTLKSDSEQAAIGPWPIKDQFFICLPNVCLGYCDHL